MKRERATGLFLLPALALALALGSCRAPSPPRGPEEACAAACSARAARCGEVACARGCNLVLDRLVEGEKGGVIECIARVDGPCDDRAWARCAARVGTHADGGPPAPPPPKDYDPE